MTEPVYEKCFHDTFKVMEAPVVHGISLDRMNDTLTSIAKILIHWIVVIEDGVDDQRAQILPEEKDAVRDLHAQVLKHHSKGICISITIILEVLLRVKYNRFSTGSRLEGQGKSLSGRIVLLVC